jgi:cell division protein FtsB
MSASTEAGPAVNLGLLGWLNRLMLWLIALAVMALIILKYVPLIRKNESMRRDLQQRQEVVQRLETTTARNQARIDALRNDPRAIEREAREQLGLARPDEQVVTFHKPVR